MKVEEKRNKKGNDWGITEYISLYDYLGRPGGKELGKQVADYCSLRKIQCQSRYIHNPVFIGHVNLFPRWAYDDFFATKALIEKYSHIYVDKAKL